jgi:hypothetical protein
MASSYADSLKQTRDQFDSTVGALTRAVDRVGKVKTDLQYQTTDALDRRRRTNPENDVSGSFRSTSTSPTQYVFDNRPREQWLVIDRASPNRSVYLNQLPSAYPNDPFASQVARPRSHDIQRAQIQRPSPNHPLDVTVKDDNVVVIEWSDQDETPFQDRALVILDRQGERSPPHLADRLWNTALRAQTNSVIRSRPYDARRYRIHQTDEIPSEFQSSRQAEEEEVDEYGVPRWGKLTAGRARGPRRRHP